MQSIYKISGLTVATVLALSGGVSFAASTLATRESASQLKADKAALQRQIKRLDADEERLKTDSASGRMSAESKDAYEVYRSEKAVKGEKGQVGKDKVASLQMEADKAALQRQMKRLDVAELRLKADAKEGRMAAESKDAERVYKDRQAVNGEKKAIANDMKK